MQLGKILEMSVGWSAVWDNTSEGRDDVMNKLYSL